MESVVSNKRINLQDEILRVTEQLIRLYQPNKIILFGSVASNKTNKWSDVDMVVVKETDKRFYDRIGEVSALINHNVPFDLLVYTPEEFEEMSKRNHFVRNEVVEKGQLLYEQAV